MSDNLHNAVQATIAGKRCGTPVFVRYLLQGTDKAEAMLAKLAQVSATVRQWLSQPLVRLHAVGSTDSGQVSLTLQFRDGATALISYARGQPIGGGVDLMVLGNHGAIYHDFGSGNLGAEVPATGQTKPDALLLAALKRALRSGKPEAMPTEAKP